MNNPKRWRRANLAAIRSAIQYGQVMGRMCAKNGNTIAETLDLIPSGARRTPYWRAFSRTLWANYFITKYPKISSAAIRRDARHAVRWETPRETVNAMASKITADLMDRRRK